MYALSSLTLSWVYECLDWQLQLVSQERASPVHLSQSAAFTPCPHLQFLVTGKQVVSPITGSHRTRVAPARAGHRLAKAVGPRLEKIGTGLSCSIISQPCAEYRGRLASHETPSRKLGTRAGHWAKPPKLTPSEMSLLVYLTPGWAAGLLPVRVVDSGASSLLRPYGTDPYPDSILFLGNGSEPCHPPQFFQPKTQGRKTVAVDICRKENLF